MIMVLPVASDVVLGKTSRQYQYVSDDLLCKIDNTSYLQAEDVNKMLKLAAQDAGEDPIKYSLHLLRIGGATALFAAGVNSLTIKIFGRWRSSTFERYTRIKDRVMATMAQCMVRSPHARVNHHIYIELWASSSPRPFRLARGDVNVVLHSPRN